VAKSLTTTAWADGPLLQRHADIATDLAQVSGASAACRDRRSGPSSRLRREVTAQQVSARWIEFRSFFQAMRIDVQRVGAARRHSVALDDGGKAPARYAGVLLHGVRNCGEREHHELDHPGQSMLTGRGIPVAGEYEIKECAGDEDHGLLGAGARLPSTTLWTKGRPCSHGSRRAGHPRMHKIRFAFARSSLSRQGWSGPFVEMAVKHGP